MEPKKKIKITIAVLSVLLTLSLLALGGTVIYNKLESRSTATISVPDEYTTKSESGEAEGNPSSAHSVTTDTENTTKTREATTIELYNKQPEENTVFQVGNMFPGDTETKYFRVRVSYHDRITVHYKATVRTGYEKLAEVLKVRVKLLTTGEIMYDGFMRDMPGSVTHQLSSQSNTTDELYYEVTAYLETSVGNEYQNKDLIADFKWWVEETGNLVDPPKTGDTSNILLWMVLAVSFGFILIFLLLEERRKKRSNFKTAKKLTGSIIAIIILSLCLCITTFAIVYASVSVENNLFHTGEVEINLNDGKPVIREHEFLFESGMTVKKDFFIENNSTWDVYYKPYLDNVSGGLADVLIVTIKDGKMVLYSGTANELSRQNVVAAGDTLKIGQRKTLTVYFHFPESAGNEAQNLDLSFNLCAEATQIKNNPNKLFD
ncbi:MAG: hypothetical protein RSB81_07910 [Anaerovoracaceae bacterium]